MSSREAILSRVKANKPAAKPLPENLSFPPVPTEDRVKQFIRVFESGGGVAVEVPDYKSIGDYLRTSYNRPESIINTVAGVGFGQEVTVPIEDGHSLSTLEMAIVKGNLAVAENAAIWVTEDTLPTRVLPFICEHLMLVVKRSTIVSTMHEAYANIDVKNLAYGVFIAGPSRTADIEQSLVIGAHGPKRAHVFVVQDNATPGL